MVLRRAVLHGVALLALAAVPLAGDYTAGLIAEVLVFAIFAMSLDLLIGYTGLMSFGHAAFFGLSAYVVTILGVHLGWSGWWGLPAGVALSAAAAAVVGYFCIRVSGIPFLMLTMAFSQLFYSVSVRWRDVTGGTDGLTGFERPALFGLSLDDRTTLYYVIAAGFALAYWFLRRVIASPLGAIFIGIRENEARMRAVGFPVQRFKLIAFVIGGGVAGFSGALYAFFNAYVSSEILHWALSGDAIIMVILGGAGTMIGPVAGTAIFLLLKYFVSTHFQYWLLVVGGIFIACVMFLPQGVWGLVVQRVAAWKRT
ncbi:MAG TPA: branched-chain amino acid ABC transporter permease [Alphaproteobacteria bacterium]